MKIKGLRDRQYFSVTENKYEFCWLGDISPNDSGIYVCTPVKYWERFIPLTVFNKRRSDVKT